MSKPKIVVVPEVGIMRVLTMRRVVVFPAPLGPMSPKISPCFIWKLNPSRARIFPNCLTRDFASTAKLNNVHLFVDLSQLNIRL